MECPRCHSPEMRLRRPDEREYGTAVSYMISDLLALVPLLLAGAGAVTELGAAVSYDGITTGPGVVDSILFV